MKRNEIEDIYIRSLDGPITEAEKALLVTVFRDDSDLADELLEYRRLRKKLKAKTPASFGPFFASRVVSAIENSREAIDHYLFSFFKRFQLVAAGVLIALLTVNVILAEQRDVKSILGLGETILQEEDVVAFDYFKSINENL
jgi:hypothetical protein